MNRVNFTLSWVVLRGALWPTFLLDTIPHASWLSRPLLWHWTGRDTFLANQLCFFCSNGVSKSLPSGRTGTWCVGLGTSSPQTDGGLCSGSWRWSVFTGDTDDEDNVPVVVIGNSNSLQKDIALGPFGSSSSPIHPWGCSHNPYCMICLWSQIHAHAYHLVQLVGASHLMVHVCN